MKDKYGRPTKGLRISVTNNCDLNCFYCHQEGCLKGDREMTPSEIADIVKIGTEFGIKKVKLTGGEPLIRTETYCLSPTRFLQNDLALLEGCVTF